MTITQAVLAHIERTDTHSNPFDRPTAKYAALPAPVEQELAATALRPEATAYALCALKALEIAEALRPPRVPSLQFDGLYAAIEQESLRNAETVRPARRVAA